MDPSSFLVPDPDPFIPAIAAPVSGLLTGSAGAVASSASSALPFRPALHHATEVGGIDPRRIVSSSDDRRAFGLVRSHADAFAPSQGPVVAPSPLPGNLGGGLHAGDGRSILASSTFQPPARLVPQGGGGEGPVTKAPRLEGAAVVLDSVDPALAPQAAADQSVWGVPDGPGPASSTAARPAPSKSTVASRKSKKGTAKDSNGKQREPSQRDVLQEFLRTKGQELIHKEVTSSVTAHVESMRSSLQQKTAQDVASVLHQYATVVNGFKAQVLPPERRLGTDGSVQAAPALATSDDGYVYLRLHEGDLSKYLVDTQRVGQAVQGSVAKLAAIEERIRQLEAVVTSTTATAAVKVSSPGAPVASGSASVAPPPVARSKGTRYTVAQTGFKTLVARLAGLPEGRGAADDGEKIYHFSYPSNAAEWTYHSALYEPTSADVATPDSELPPNATSAYRRLRFNFHAAWDADPNHDVLAPILALMIKDAARYELPSWINTPHKLMDQVLKRTWTTWARKYVARAALSPQAKASQAAEDAITRAKRRRMARVQDKLERRLEAAQALQLHDDARRLHDDRNAAVLVKELQSDDYTDEETIPGTAAPRSVRVRRVPAYRSTEATRALRILDAAAGAPKKVVVDRDEFFDIPGRLPSGLPRWALKDEWIKAHPDRAIATAVNRGPWSGQHSVVSDAQSYGTGRYVASLSNVSRPGHHVTVVGVPVGWVVPEAPSIDALPIAMPSAAFDLAAGGVQIITSL